MGNLDDKFYENAVDILNNSGECDFAGKTPALILPKEREGHWREKYSKLLFSKIENGEIKARYLFSLLVAREKILEYPKEDIEKILENWEKVLQYDNLDLRFVNHKDFESCIVGEDKAIITTEPVIDENLEERKRIFNELFESASSNHMEVIEDIRKEVGG